MILHGGSPQWESLRHRRRSCIPQACRLMFAIQRSVFSDRLESRSSVETVAGLGGCMGVLFANVVRNLLGTPIGWCCPTTRMVGFSSQALGICVYIAGERPSDHCCFLIPKNLLRWLPLTVATKLSPKLGSLQMIGIIDPPSSILLISSPLGCLRTSGTAAWFTTASQNTPWMSLISSVALNVAAFTGGMRVGATGEMGQRKNRAGTTMVTELTRGSINNTSQADRIIPSNISRGTLLGRRNTGQF